MLWLIVVAVFVCALWVMQVNRALLDKAATWQRDRVAEMLEVIDRKNHERYADLLLKLTVLRRQNEILLRWANKQDAIALHELEGRNPDDLRRKQVVFEGCDWIDDWKPSVDPWSWEH